MPAGIHNNSYYLGGSLACSLSLSLILLIIFSDKVGFICDWIDGVAHNVGITILLSNVSIQRPNSIYSWYINISQYNRPRNG